MYHIGVTGTRYGATRRQLYEARVIVQNAVDKYGTVTVHEGCCDGFDDQFTELLAGEANVLICGHPPTEKRWSTNNHRTLHTATELELPYLNRNKAIVRHGKDLVLGVPRQREPVTRGSGTWQCVRESLRQSRKTLLIYPNGDIGPAKIALERAT